MQRPVKPPRKWFVNRKNMAHFYAVRFSDLPIDSRTGGPDIRHAQRLQTANAHLVSLADVFRTAGVPIPQWKCSLCDWRTRKQRTAYRLWNAMQEFIRHLETKHGGE